MDPTGAVLGGDGAIERIGQLYEQARRDAPEEFRPRLDALHAQLFQPLHVAIAGRVKAGKSTLVNALLGKRVARTDARECTRVVTWFRYAPSEKVVLVERSGSRRRLNLDPDGLVPADLGLPPEEVAAIEVDLSLDRLRTFTLADTPGLNAPDGAATATTVESLGIDADSASAVSAAEAVLFVLNQQVRETDVDVLRAFRAVSAGAGGDVVSAFAVLNKADLLTGEDPMAVGAAIARRVADQLGTELAGVFAYSGLSAEAALCGIFTEADARAVEHLAGLPADRQRRLLSSPETFLRGHGEFTPAEAERLWHLLRESGVREVLAAWTAGGRGAVALKRRLLERSGHRVLEARLADLFEANSVALKAGASLERLEMLAWSSDDDWGERLRDSIERLRLDPALHVILEAGVLRQVRRGEVALPDDLRAEVERLVATPVTERSDPSSGLRRWRERANTQTNPREVRLARVVARSYELALSQESRR